KQQHTAKRIFGRLRDEHGFTGGITIVKDYVAGWRQRAQEMFVPLVHPPGHAQAGAMPGQKRATPPVERDPTNAPSTAATATGAARRSERGRSPYAPRVLSNRLGPRT